MVIRMVSYGVVLTSLWGNTLTCNVGEGGQATAGSIARMSSGAYRSAIARQEPQPRSQGGRRWLVFNPNGEGLGSVDMPPDLDVWQIGHDFVLGVWQDEHEVEYVRRHVLAGRR